MEMRPTVFAPTLAAGSPIAEISKRQDVVEPRPGVAVVVVVRLPHAAKRVDGQLIRIAEVTADDREVRSVQVFRLFSFTCTLFSWGGRARLR